MSMITLLFSFAGSIKRREWWIGTLVLLAVELSYLGLAEPGFFAGEKFRLTFTPYFELMLAYPAAALVVKRFADLGWSIAIGCLLIAGNIATSLPDFTWFGDHPTIEGTTLALGLMAILAEIVICGCLKGGQQARGAMVQPT
jgi:uncharacterized membrane protein YhaH (DUF805 family)